MPGILEASSQDGNNWSFLGWLWHLAAWFGLLGLLRSWYLVSCCWGIQGHFGLALCCSCGWGFPGTVALLGWLKFPRVPATLNYAAAQGCLAVPDLWHTNRPMVCSVISRPQNSQFQGDLGWGRSSADWWNLVNNSNGDCCDYYCWMMWSCEIILCNCII